MQQCKVHICSVPSMPPLAYFPWVKKAPGIDVAKADVIAAVSRWRDALLKRAGRNANQMAGIAGISATTITRNMGPSSETTAKLENLHLLARGAGVTSIVDFLNSEARGLQIHAPSQPSLPTEDELTHMLRGLMLSAEFQSRDPDERARMLAMSLTDRFRAETPLRDPAVADKASSAAKRPRGGAGNQPSSGR